MANVRLQTQTQTQERGILFFNVVAAASHKTSFDIYGYIRVQFLFSHFCILFLSFFLSFFLYTRQSTTHHIDLQWTERRIAYASMLFLCTHTCTSRTFTWNASYTYNVGVAHISKCCSVVAVTADCYVHTQRLWR